MSPKVYRFAIGFFVLLAAVALTAIYHVVEESVFFKETYSSAPVDVYPLWTVLGIGIVGSIVFGFIHAKKKTDS